MIDPNLLLRNFRNALASGHHSVALIAMATMDEQLTLGSGSFPDDWFRTITTQEQLDQLPHLSIVQYEYVSGAGWKLHEVWERRNESWYCIAAPLNPPGLEFGLPRLPVRLLWDSRWRQ